MDDDEIRAEVERFTTGQEQVGHARRIWRDVQREILEKLEKNEKLGTPKAFEDATREGYVDMDFLLALLTVGINIYEKEMRRGVLMSGYVASKFGMEEAMNMMQEIEGKK